MSPVPDILLLALINSHLALLGTARNASVVVEVNESKRSLGSLPLVSSPLPTAHCPLPHASRLTPHASRLTPHASRLTPHG